MVWVLIVFWVLLFLYFDFVFFVSSFGLLDVIFVMKLELVNLERKLRVFLLVKGDWGWEIFCFDFNVVILIRMGLLWWFIGINWVGDGGEIWLLLLIEVCECFWGFCWISLKIEVLENECVLVFKFG